MKSSIARRLRRLAPYAVSLLLAACQAAPSATPATPTVTTPSATVAPTATAMATLPPLVSTDTPVPPTPLPTEVITPAVRVFTIGLAAAPGSLDPANAVDESALLITRHLYEGLTAYAPGTTRVIPALAESWKTTDAITWTFHLRPNVYFSNGAPFTATVAAKNFERWFHRQPPGDYVFWKSQFSGFADERNEKGEPLSLLASVDAPDAQTLIVILRQPYAALPGTLAMPSFAMVNPTVFDQPSAPGELAGWPSAGTGPLVIQEWTAEGLVHLVRNPVYWGAPAAPDELVFKPIPDDTQRLMALEVGEIDGLSRLNPSYYTAVRGDAKLRVDFDPALNVLYLGFNQAHAPWNNLDCRTAVAYALDKARYVQEFFPGDAETATTLLPPAVWGYQASASDRARNLAYARAYWQTCLDSGIKLTQPITFYVPPPLARPYLPDDSAALGAAIQADLASAGITVTVASPPWPTWLGDLRTGRADLFLLGAVGVNGDPDSFLCALFCGNEPAFNTDKKGSPLPPDPALAQTLLAARAVADPARRETLYAQAQARLFETIPAIPLAYRQSAWAYRASVRGNVPSPIEDVFLELRQQP